MDATPGTTIITTSRANWTIFIDRRTASGHVGAAAYITQMVGCWMLTTHPSLSLGGERLALWDRLMTTPDCPDCAGFGAVNGQPCEICDGTGEATWRPVWRAFCQAAAQFGEAA